MGYGILEVMGYGLHFPANQLGGRQNLWPITGYGVSQVWVMAGSTVHKGPAHSHWFSF